MSSFKGIAIIDGKKRNLLRAEYTFYKLKNITGNPTTSTRKIPLHLLFESTGFDDDLYHYMFSSNANFSGELIFYDKDGLKILYKVEFHNAYIVGLREEFDHQDNLPLHISLSITCGAVKVRDVKKIEMWVPDDPFVLVEPTTREETEEPTLLGYFFEDENGNQIEQEKLKQNQEFFLVVEAKNAEGESTTINLDDDKLDYIYNGQIAKNDTLRGISITGEQTRIQLTAIEQKKTTQNG